MLPARVLVIEDDPAVQSLLRSVLELKGYEVLASESAVDPTEVAQLRPQLVLLDLRLGTGTAGWDFLQTMKVTPAARRIPVVVCTADSAFVDRESARFNELAAGVVIKPFNVDDLLARIEAATLPFKPERVLSVQ
jgi:CheY-like chemotaxis protein